MAEPLRLSYGLEKIILKRGPSFWRWDAESRKPVAAVEANDDDGDGDSVGTGDSSLKSFW